MPLDKEIIIIGDIEMGAGNLTDDFIADKRLAAVILQLARREHPVDLVLNGDTFDFLKCPSMLLPLRIYPRHVTEQVSMDKLRLIYEAHTPVFDALRTLVQQEDKKVFFIVGNHDPDLLYPSVQHELRRLLVNEERVIFPGLKYEENKVHVEHGHQYDIFFKMNMEKLFMKHKGEKFLNLPFVSFGLIGAFMRIKEENPFLERIFPRPALFTHHQVIARKVNRNTFGYFVKSLVYYPFRFYSDPSYTFPSGLFRELYTRLRTLHWDVSNVTAAFMKESQVEKEIIVLGHIHEKRIARGRKKTIIHPGSWRDEYTFNPKTRELIPRRKRYVQIFLIDGVPHYNLIDLQQSRKIVYFDDVLKDEKKHIRMAAAEESFQGLTL